MAAFTYNATRKLVVGRTPGEQVSFDLRVHAENPDRRAERVRRVSYSGRVDDVYRRADELVVLQSELVNDRTSPPQYVTNVTRAQMEEFLASTEAGEAVTVDLEGTVAAPVDPRPAVREDRRSRPRRVGLIYFRYNFSFRFTDV